MNQENKENDRTIPISALVGFVFMALSFAIIPFMFGEEHILHRIMHVLLNTSDEGFMTIFGIITLLVSFGMIWRA